MRNPVIGRAAEQRLLQKVLASNTAEFIAVYGRRRVGKTHLIRMFFQNTGVYIEITGLKDGSFDMQLSNFMLSLTRVFPKILEVTPPKNWREALTILTENIERVVHTTQVILFIDELPWLATKRSGLMQALDYFWNTRWSQWNHFKCIVCGSAASWMIEQLVHAKGGLHNRLTNTMLLRPLTLKESKEYCRSRKIKVNNKQLIDLYMAVGGIPYYLNHVDPALSVAQNINQMCFTKDGVLYHEFLSLFTALFETAEITETLIRLIATQHQGISRNILLEKSKIHSGGQFNTKIKELIASDFVQAMVPYGNVRKNVYFRVSDLYTLFYLKWIDTLYKSSRITSDKKYWEKKINTASYFSWAGYAFETVCFNHVDAIAHALGLDQIGYEVGSWRYIPKKGAQESGAQIDLLFDRADGVITLCEIKYTSKPFVITKREAKTLMNKIAIFTEHFKTSKQISLVLISSMGMKKNIWSEDLIDQVITGEDLFFDS
jgi:uncharacterized protein